MAIVVLPATAQQRAETDIRAPRLLLENVPVAVDSANQAGWWRPAAVDGDTTYFAFNAPSATSATRHEVHIAKRMRSGDWVSDCLKDGAGECVEYVNDIGHNQPTIVLDGDGHIHAFVSMHNDTWRYYRSGQPGDVTTMANHSDELPDQDGAMTYPVAGSAPNGDLYLMVRVDAGDGYNSRLYHWDNEDTSWSRVAILARQPGWTPYPDGVQVDNDGNVHLAWEWARGGPSGSRYFGSYMVYRPADDAFVAVSGRDVDLPATTETPDVVYGDDDGITQFGKLALVNTTTPNLAGIAFRYRPEGSGVYEIRWASWTAERGWETEVVDADLNTTPTLAATHDRGIARIYYVKQARCDQLDQLEGGALHVAEKRVPGAAGDWTVSWIGGGSDVDRIEAETGQRGADILYLTASRDGNPIADPVLRHGTLERTPARPGVAPPDVVPRDPGERPNWAYGSDVSVSSTWDEASVGACAVDGNFWGEPSRWISASADPEPTIELALDEPVSVAEIHVYTGRNAGAIDRAANFQVDLRVDGEWQELAAVRGNTVNPAIVINPASTVTDEIRVRFPRGVNRVYEIEVYSTVEAEPVGVSLSAEPASLAFPGDATEVTARLLNRTPEAISETAVITVPDGWTAEPVEADYQLEPYGSADVTFAVTSPEDAPSHSEFDIEVRPYDSASAATYTLAIREGVVYITDGAPSYTQTGVWEDSLLPGHNDTLTRFTQNTGATATWAPELRQAGTYNVYAWYPANANTTTAAQFTVDHADGEELVIVNQRDTADQWYQLGTWEFDAGNTGSVTITKVDPVAHRAGAVWFERVDDAPPGDTPTTGFEDRGGVGWTTHEEELAFLAALADTSERVELIEVGESVLGRPMHLIKVGHPRPPDDAAIATGMSVLGIGAQHGSEPAGQEASLQLARDLAFSDDPNVIDHLSQATVLLIPTANPDGRAANTRGNANGVDVNRDHLRFNTPEGRAVATVLRDLQPDIVADLHERPGGLQPDMEMVWSMNLNVDEPLRTFAQELIEDSVFPGLQAHGFTTGELGRPGTTSFDERIARNAIGLRHSIGMVTETPWDGEPLRRVATQKATLGEILAFQHEHGDTTAALTSAAAERRAADGAAGAVVHFGGPQDPVADPAGCGYLLNNGQAELIEGPAKLFGVRTEQVSANGVFLTMAQPMMTVVPLLVDERAPHNIVAGRSLDDCSDLGSEEPPPDPPEPSPPAEYATDFSGDHVGTAPAGWSSQWRASQWLVQDDPRRLEHSVAGASGRRALTWDDVGDEGVVTGDVEVFGLVRAPAAGETVFQLALHVSGEAGSENAYYVDARLPGVSVDPNNLRINRYANGAVTFPGQTVLPFTVEEGEWYRVVLRREGDSLRAKMWPDRTDEPGWQVVVPVDTTHHSGRVGVAHFTPGVVNDWAFIGVGTGGAPAPRVPS
jgi:hypothetical protein